MELVSEFCYSSSVVKLLHYFGEGCICPGISASRAAPATETQKPEDGKSRKKCSSPKALSLIRSSRTANKEDWRSWWSPAHGAQGADEAQKSVVGELARHVDGRLPIMGNHVPKIPCPELPCYIYSMCLAFKMGLYPGSTCVRTEDSRKAR